MDDAARLVAAALLLAAAAAKLRARADLPTVLAAYGVPARVRPLAAVALVAAEAVLGVLLLVGIAVRPVALAAVALGLVFAVALLRARLQGRKRLRCGCFGAAERPTSYLLARALAFTALAGVAAAGDALPDAPSRDTLVLAALAVLALAVVTLGALVLALYRQVGVLSLRIAPRAALELAEEGPPVGADAPALPALTHRGSELVAFFSRDCRLCRDLAPAVRALAREGVAAHAMYEEENADAFREWNVPGTPYVVHVLDGAVVAKGLVNTLEQLDQLLAVGRARRAHAAA